MAQATEENQDIQKLDQVLLEVRSLKQEIGQLDQKFDNYQKSTQWGVQLAFSLIAAATVTVLVSTVLGR